MGDKKPESFLKSTESYLKWLSEKLTLVPEDLREKERRMRKGTPFEFLRATFYRWAQWWPLVCKELDQAFDHPPPCVLGVGDLHVENFGTWRDLEGRLVWGVNDFDEGACLPYTNDLVRLAVSARFAIEEHETEALLKQVKDQPISEERLRKQLQRISQAAEPRFQRACDVILSGYRNTLAPDRKDLIRRPFILAEKDIHAWLREIALNKLRQTEEGNPFDKFLENMTQLGNVADGVPRSALEVLNQSMPEPGMSFRIGKRVAGLGSLGRQRFCAVVDDWNGGILVREAKCLAPSAWKWWKEKQVNGTEILYQEILDHAVRSRDPWVRVFKGRENWIVRRLAPDSDKIELKDLPKQSDLEEALWQAMGREVANVHLPLGNVWEDLQERDRKSPNWLYQYAQGMAAKVMEDWHENRASR